MADSQHDLDFSQAQGREGYTDAMNDFMTMWKRGDSLVDIMLLLRESYPEDLINTVLEEARLQGYL